MFVPILTNCQSKYGQTEKRRDEIRETLYSGTGKWDIESYEYTSKNQGIEQTKKYENCGTFEFDEKREGKMILEADELMISRFRYGIEDFGGENHLVLHFNTFPLISGSQTIQYNKLSLRTNEFTIVYDHSAFRTTFVCKKVLD